MSRLSIRKHSCFEDFSEQKHHHHHHHHHHHQEKQSAFSTDFLTSPSTISTSTSTSSTISPSFSSSSSSSSSSTSSSSSAQPPSPNNSSKKPLKQLYSYVCSALFLFLIAISVVLHCCSTNLDQSHSIPPPKLSFHSEHSTANIDDNGEHASSSHRNHDDDEDHPETAQRFKSSAAALRGLGRVFRRGNRAMNEVIVAHVGERIPSTELRVFLRTLHRCGITARADVVLLFEQWNTLPSLIVEAIHEENESFQKLLLERSSPPPRASKIAHEDGIGPIREQPNARNESSRIGSQHLITSTMMTITLSNSSISPFNINAFSARKASNPDLQPLWGSHNSSSPDLNSNGNIINNKTGVRDAEPAHQSFPNDGLVWGSIVGFDVSELNPDDTLQGFIDNPPLSLRRWACYQMLLGMVKHKFRHILLTDVRGVAILGDPLAMVRRKVGLYIPLEDRPWASSAATSSRIRELSSETMGTRDMAMISRELLSFSSGTNNSTPHFGWSRQHLHAQHSRRSGHTKNEESPNVKRSNNMVISGSSRRRGRSRGTAMPGGLYERVYGRSMWSHLEEGEKKKRLVNSGAIVGSMQHIRGLANTMVTEIVRVALERKSRDAFPDNVLLSSLLHKSSSVLGKRVLDHLHLLDNSESFVHSLTGSRQFSLFSRELGRLSSSYPMIHGMGKSPRWSGAQRLIHRDICSSPLESLVYNDCYIDR